MLSSLRLSAPFCILALITLMTACQKNKIAAQPPVAVVPSTAPPSRPKHRQTPSSATPATPAAATSAPGPTSVSAQPAPQPRLGQMLSPAEEQRYNTLIDQSLGNTRGSLSSIGSRSLSVEQQSTVQQIQHFMQQAQDTRKADLIAAKGLADKAEVLARDLVRSLK